MSIPTKLIVGLGNPGKKFENTRHNIGFSVLDRLVSKHESSFKAHARIPALVAEWKNKGNRWIAIKPVTFMNLSGQAVSAAMNFWKQEISSLLIVVDDVEIPLRTLRIRQTGSAGGHNGLKSIIEMLKSRDFSRLRIGVGRPADTPEKDLSEWVLEHFQKTELIWVEESINKSVCAIETWVLEGPMAAMNQFNATSPKDTDISKPASA